MTMIEATCNQCGEAFRPKRSSRRYCSGTCRVAAHRGLSIQGSRNQQGGLARSFDDGEGPEAASCNAKHVAGPELSPTSFRFAALPLDPVTAVNVRREKGLEWRAAL
jgi:hypothetical protein